MNQKFWAKQAKLITDTSAILDLSGVLGGEEEGDFEDTKRKEPHSSIYYIAQASKPGEAETFERFGLKLRNEYNNSQKYHTARASPVYSAKEIVDALNNKGDNSLLRLDIIGHGGHNGMFFTYEVPDNDEQILPRPIVPGSDYYIIALKRNLYIHRRAMQDDAVTNAEGIEGILAKVGPNAASLEDINFKIFKNNSVIEFHGCSTAGRPDYANWNDTSVWLFREDNITFWASKQLYRHGKTKAVAIGHYASSFPDGEIAEALRPDYRQARRVVYHNGKVILDTKKTGDLWDDIQALLAR